MGGVCDGVTCLWQRCLSSLSLRMCVCMHTHIESMDGVLASPVSGRGVSHLSASGVSRAWTTGHPLHIRAAWAVPTHAHARLRRRGAGGHHDAGDRVRRRLRPLGRCNDSALARPRACRGSAGRAQPVRQLLIPAYNNVLT